MDFGWKPYVPVAERRRAAAREAAKMRKKGESLAPVIPTGPIIAKTFWGKAWCDNLERYSDYDNRLPRGRTYVRNGSVIDLKIGAGQVTALVSGSNLYQVQAQIAPLDPRRWKSICSDCSGAVDSLIELLQARFSQAVMARMCHRETGLFPALDEIRFSCSCPDWADMCKHVAAVLYGIGARLDQQPELLFQLRKVDHTALIAVAGTALKLGGKAPAAGRMLDGPDLSALFGIELAAPATEAAPAAPVPPKRRRSTGGASSKVTAKQAAASSGRKKTPAKKRGKRSASQMAAKSGRVTGRGARRGIRSV